MLTRFRLAKPTHHQPRRFGVRRFVQPEAALALAAGTLACEPGKMTGEVLNNLAGIAGSALENYAFDATDADSDNMPVKSTVASALSGILSCVSGEVSTVM